MRPASLRLPFVAVAFLLATHAQASADGPQADPLSGAQAPAPVDARGTYMALIRELRDQGQAYAALAHVATYEARWGASPQTELLRADALRATGQDDAAARAYQRLLGGPEAAAAHRGLGLMAARAGRLPEAARHLAHAAGLAPTNAATLSDLGFAHLALGEVQAARVPLMTAAQLAPTDSRVLANLASYFRAAGQHAQADAVLASPYLSEAARTQLRGAAAPGPLGEQAPLRLEHSLAARP